MAEYNLESLTSYPKFQEADLNKKLGWLDNFSNTMIQSGKPQEAASAQRLAAELDMGAEAASFAGQVTGNIAKMIAPNDEGVQLRATLGEEAYTRANNRFQKIADLEERGMPMAVEGGFVYTKPNPFGPGFLLESDDGEQYASIVSEDAVNSQVKEGKIKPIHKDEIYKEVLDGITPKFTDGLHQEDAPPPMGINSVDSLLGNPSFQLLPMADQRNLLRAQALGFRNTNNPQEMMRAQDTLALLNQEQEAMVLSGQMAKEGGWDDFLLDTLERGATRLTRNWAIEDAKDAVEMAKIIEAANGITPEQSQIVRNNLSNILGIKGPDSLARIAEFQSSLDGAPLENIEPSKLREYANTLSGAMKGEYEAKIRERAIALIPMADGMKEFQAGQQQLEASGASWQDKLSRAARDTVDNPFDVAMGATIESMASQPLSVAATAGLWAIPGGQGPAAAATTNILRATGTGLIAGMTESSYAYTQALDEARKPVGGEEIPMEEVLRDPARMREVNDFAFSRGVGVGTVEGVVGYVLPGIMSGLDRRLAMGAYQSGKRVSPIARIGLHGAPEVALQSASEGAGEFVAQQNQYEANMGELFLEMAAGLGGPDTFAMWQSPQRTALANENLDARATRLAARNAKAAEMIAQAKEAAVSDPAQLSAALDEIETQTKGIYAQGITPQWEESAPVLNAEGRDTGMRDFEVFVEEDTVPEDTAPTPVTQEEGLASTEPVIAPVEPEIAQETQEAQPILSPDQVQEGQVISVIEDDGSVTTGEATINPNGDILLNGKVRSATTGRMWNGVPKPKANKAKLSRGDVIYDGANVYRFDDEDPADFTMGYRDDKGILRFDKTERRDLTDGFINDPRVRVYAKEDFDAAMQEFNSRPEPKADDKFGVVLSKSPEKGSPSASPETAAQSATPAQETPTEGAQTQQGPSSTELNEAAEVPVVQSPATKTRRTLFKIRAHKDVSKVLAKATERMNEWVKKTKVVEQGPDFIKWTKDQQSHELHRTQDPENFDARVKQLTKEDQDFRDYKEARTWQEVPIYQKLAEKLRKRISSSAKATSKSARAYREKRGTKGLLEDAHVNTVMQAIFVLDNTTAQWAAARFGLRVPNASLITVDDIAEMMWGAGIENDAVFAATVPAKWNPVSRLITLRGNASVVDVLHEMYHNFLVTAAPLALNTEQYTALLNKIQAQLDLPSTQAKMRDRYSRAAQDMRVMDDQGNLTEAAQEVFVGMMTAWHLDGKIGGGMTEQDRGTLEAITNFFRQVFQDLGRTPLATLSDDSYDFINNFFRFPAVRREQAMQPEARQERINETVVSQRDEVTRIAQILTGESDEVLEDDDTQLPAEAQILGDRLVNSYRQGEQPVQGRPFTSGGRVYVIEGEAVSEISDGGATKTARKIQDVEWNGQTAEPPVAGTLYEDGTTDVPDSEISSTAVREPATKPILRAKSGNHVILTDSDTGIVIYDKEGEMKGGKTWEYTPEALEGDGDFASIDDGAKYQLGRMNRRTIGKPVSGGAEAQARAALVREAASQTLREIANDGTYRQLPNAYIMEQVEARMNAHASVLGMVKDATRLLSRKNLTGLSKAFDPESKFDGVGLAGITYYLQALDSRLNLVAKAQENGHDLDIDLNDVILLQTAVHKRLEYLHREMGRGLNISKAQLTYNPETAIEVLEDDLIRNNSAFKAFLKRSQAFRKKYDVRQLTDSQLTAALEEFKISPIFKNALVLYSKGERTERDFELEAKRIWVVTPDLPGRVSPKSRELLNRLSVAAKASKYNFLRDLYGQRANLLVEAERGPAVIDSLNAMYFNNMLFSLFVAKVNAIGFWPQYFGNTFSYFLNFLSQDWRKFGDPVKNIMAMTEGLKLAGQSFPEGGSEAVGIAIGGQRGTSMEVFERGIGTIVTSQTLLFGRPGTAYANRNKLTSVLKRLVATMLTEMGRRVATVFDAPYKLIGEYTLLGAQLYREAWDSYYVAGKPGDRSKFIQEYIDDRINIKKMDEYFRLADAEIAANADLLMETSVGLMPARLPSMARHASELGMLRNLMAFNMRREDREERIREDPQGQQMVEDARRFAYENTYSNDPRGAFKLLDAVLGNLNTIGPLSKILGEAAKTHENRINGRYRWFGGGAILPIVPFKGNISRMLETFAKWTPIGILNAVGTNEMTKAIIRGRYRKKQSRKGAIDSTELEKHVNSTMLNRQDVYTQMEIATTAIRGIIGSVLLWGIVNALGSGDDDDEKEAGVSGHRGRDVWGRNGKNIIIPPYSVWWRLENGDIAFAEYREHPQLLATLGSAATFNEMGKRDGETPFFGLVYRSMAALGASSTQVGAYDAVIDLGKIFEDVESLSAPGSGKKIGRNFMTHLAKQTKNYAMPLNRIQKEMILYQQMADPRVMSAIIGRPAGVEMQPEKGAFWATFVANTFAEGMLPAEQRARLDQMIGFDGKIKEPNFFLDRLGGVIKAPPPAATWMINNGYVINREDTKRTIPGVFDKKSQKELAEVRFAKVNNGMFAYEHGAEIELRAMEYYWPWIEQYSQDQAQAEKLKTFETSATNELRKAQDLGKHETFKDLQQKDINALVNEARDIASLEMSAIYYTDDELVRAWTQAIAQRRAVTGYRKALASPATNKQLEAAE